MSGAPETTASTPASTAFVASLTVPTTDPVAVPTVWPGHAGTGADTAAQDRMSRACRTTPCILTDLLTHHHHDDHAPDDEQRIADGIRDRIAEGGHLALRFILNRTERRGRRARAGARTKQDAGVELEDVLAREDADDERHQRDEDAPEEQAHARILKSANEAGSGADADDGDEDREPDVVEGPERRFGDASKRGVHGTQVAADEAGNQRAAARAEAERHATDADGERPDQRADDDADPHEHDVGLLGGSIGITKMLDDPVDMAFGAGHLHHVSAIDLQPLREGHFDARPCDLAEVDAAPLLRLHLGDLADGLALQRLVRDDDVHALRGEVEQLAIVDLRAKRALVLQQQLPRGRDRQHIVRLHDRIGIGFDNGTAAPRPLDEEALWTASSGSLHGELTLELLDALAHHRRRLLDVIGAHVDLEVG